MLLIYEVSCCKDLIYFLKEVISKFYLLSFANFYFIFPIYCKILMFLVALYV